MVPTALARPAGRPRAKGFEGFAAACVQHERDHLDGILCIDYLRPDPAHDLEPSLYHDRPPLHPLARQTPANAAAPVEAITDDVRTIWDDMVDTMEAMPGYGLAAPQIGVMLRLAVVDCSDARGQAILMANPEILHASAQPREHEEASPNLPGVSAKITRPRAVTVRYLNADGVIEDRDFVNLWATSVQHQIDHLNGKMYLDNLSDSSRRKMLVGAGAEKLGGRRCA